jgi:hypothetical protein
LRKSSHRYSLQDVGISSTRPREHDPEKRPRALTRWVEADFRDKIMLKTNNLGRDPIQLDHGLKRRRRCSDQPIA